MLQNIRALLNDDAGATLVEYALIVALIAVASIAGLTALKNNIGTSLSNTSAALQTKP